MREERPEWQPLTAGQMDFWEEFVFHPEQPVSTVAHCLELRGPLDEAALIAALTRTAAEADTLALTFREGADGRVWQRIDRGRVPQVLRHDLRAEADPWAAAQAVMRADIDAVLDLRRQPLSAQMLLRLGEDRWAWYFRGHHMILDGYGMSLIEGRAAQLYAHLTGHSDAGAPFGRLADFLAEDAAYHASAACAQDRAYWQEQLAPFRAALPVLRKGAEDYGAAPLCAAFAPGTAFEHDLQAAAARLRLSWADTLTLISGAWLALHDPDRADPLSPLPIWLPYMSRMGSVSANIPAMVVNILPLIVTPQPDEPLVALLGRMARDLRRHRRHGRYRIEEMARDCGLSAGHRFHFTPLINVMPFAPPRFPGLVATRHVLAAGPGDGFNISFLADGAGAGIRAAIEADPATQSRDSFPVRVAGFEGWLEQALQALVQVADAMAV
ncbi:condensation domain-containing protein [Paracoccus sp. S1E-3]|uniref:condensation domain-containing protein n=1 Tax=Paracoccus sp. S1E-3 TaxID=2756130 RepID=UPI0015EF1349|nr:condensation domain-containing protein [Paracoccus sp. S1E-3]MBA4489252.1 condensation protein [Paracoccus sp. S1E-3]